MRVDSCQSQHGQGTCMLVVVGVNMRGDVCCSCGRQRRRGSHSGGCVLQHGRGRACLCLWVNVRVVGYVHGLVDAVLVVQVIIAAVGVKKERTT